MLWVFFNKSFILLFSKFISFVISSSLKTLLCVFDNKYFAIIYRETVVEVKVFVDAGAIMYLLGTEMDYKKEEFSSSFVFKNPNETERCGCGESFKI